MKPLDIWRIGAYLLITAVCVVCLIACDKSPNDRGSGQTLISVNGEFANVVGGLQVTDTTSTVPRDQLLITEFKFRDAITNELKAVEFLRYEGQDNDNTFIIVLPDGHYNVLQIATAIDDSENSREWQVEVSSRIIDGSSAVVVSLF